MLSIQNKTALFKQLNQLTADKKPLFGVMTAQQMMEHLLWTVRFSNGSLPQQQITSAETAASLKLVFVFSDEAYPMNIKTPLLKNGLPQLEFDSLFTAIEQLKKALQQFDKYYQRNINATAVNPAMGELSYAEWILFHNKHFTHHFKQFGLL